MESPQTSWSVLCVFVSLWFTDFIQRLLTAGRRPRFIFVSFAAFVVTIPG
jgi:hypothetical protein